MKLSKGKMMLSVITDEISQDLETAVSLAKRYHCSGIELRSVWDTPVEQLCDDRLYDIKRIAEENGLAISAISTSLLKVDWGTNECEKFRKIIHAAHVLGCNMIRGFSFWKCEAYSDAQYAQILAEYDLILGQEQLTMVIENDPSVNLPTAAELGRFFSKYHFENIGILWDPGNEIYTDGAPIPYPDGYEMVRNYVRHVHLKDAVRTDATTVGTALGKGAVDYRGQLGALIALGYSGWITLETHYKKTGTISEELLRRPGGAAFSAGGYEATEECMIGLGELLTDLCIEM